MDRRGETSLEGCGVSHLDRAFVIPKSDQREAAKARVCDYIDRLPNTSLWKVQIAATRPQRSEAQLRYLNGVCYKLIGDTIGYERDEVSEFLCGVYFGWKEKRVPKKPSNPNGVESVPIRTTTTDEHGARSVLNKQEFADYVAFVQRFAANKGIHIPDPDQLLVEPAEEQAA